MKEILLSRSSVVLIVIMAVAFGLRSFSFLSNSHPHGDVVEDLAAAVSFKEHGTLQTGPPSSEPYYYSLEKGKFLDQHPPLWPVLGGSIAYLANAANVFNIFKILSLLSGMGLILLLYLIGKKLIAPSAGLWLALFGTISYLLMDYAGNGAIYSLHAFLYLGWIMAAYSVLEYSRTTFQYRRFIPTAMLGILSGIGLMTNYQMIVLVPAALIVLAAAHVRPDSARVIEGLRHGLLFFVALLVMATPMFIRNTITFGSPLYSVNMEWVYEKAGLVPQTNNGILVYESWRKTFPAVLKSVITFWLPRNLYYINRKLFILAPGLFVFFLFALIDYIFSKNLLKRMLPVLAVLAVHTLVSAAWPITKFRFFVPLLPLVFIIGIEFVYRHWQDESRRRRVLVFCAVATLLGSYLTFYSTPAHTYYYDGAITTDPYGERGELKWQQNNLK